MKRAFVFSMLLFCAIRLNAAWPGGGSGSGGSGNAVLSATQTWTGGNTFSSATFTGAVIISSSVKNGNMQMKLVEPGQVFFEDYLTPTGQFLATFRSVNGSASNLTGAGSAMALWDSSDPGRFMSGAMSGDTFMLAKISQSNGTIGAGFSGNGNSLMYISTTTNGVELAFGKNGGARFIMKPDESPAGELQIQFGTMTITGLTYAAGGMRVMNSTAPRTANDVANIYTLYAPGSGTSFFDSTDLIICYSTGPTQNSIVSSSAPTTACRH